MEPIKYFFTTIENSAFVCFLTVWYVVGLMQSTK